MAKHYFLAMLREWRSRLAGLFGRSRHDRDLEQEIQSHLELAAEELRRRGVAPEEAARRARVEAGGLTQTIEVLRDRRGIPPLSTFWLDVKLGMRMLRKHWALTLFGGLAMACAMTLSASLFNLVEVLQGTSVPLEEGDRVVVVQPVDPETRQPQNPSAQIFEHWRADLHSLVDVGAFRTVEHDLRTKNAVAPAANVAEISAAGFALARIAPRMGRFLLPEDERPGAPPVVVIGYSAWQSTFAADPGVVGQPVQLDGVSHTVVGVMPDGFRFPLNHQYWTTLHAAPPDPVTVFARLAPGATLESAQAELAAVGFGASIADAVPGPRNASGRPLRPFLRPYIAGLTGERGVGIVVLLPFVLPLLLIPPCANIGVLIYARTVARMGEFAVRTTLGASRARIISQIFVEMLVLAAAAAGVAILLAPAVAERLSYMVSFNQPFWMNFGFSYKTILFTAGLTVVAALISGAIPARRATAAWQLAGLNAWNRSSPPQLGKTWTAIVVAQVALSVAVVPTAVEFAWMQLRPAILGPGFPVDDFLTARLDLAPGPDPSPAAAARFSTLSAEVARQLDAEPGVTAVTLSKYKPMEERNVDVEADAPGPAQRTVSVNFNQVDAAFFDVFGIRLLAGRGFEPADTDPQRGTIVVNRSFANRVLPGENPLGRTVRVLSRNARGGGAAGRYEIVGVVNDQFALSGEPTMYRPLTPSAAIPDRGKVLSVHLAIQGAALPPGFANRIGQIAAAMDPVLSVDDVQPLSEIYFFLSLPDYIFGSLPVLIVLGVLLFATVGIYTRMSFAVVQRRREIGIRSALGASPWTLVTGIFRSVFVPISIGVGLGGVTALVLDSYLSPLLFSSAEGRPLPWILPAAEAFILLMGVAAVFGPVRRTLRVDAVEALRES